MNLIRSSFRIAPKVISPKNFIKNSSDWNCTENMRFIQFEKADAWDTKHQYLGVVEKDGKFLRNITESLCCTKIRDMVTFIQQNYCWDEFTKELEKMQLEEVTDDIKLLAPITNPQKIICIGLNYKSHCSEQKKEDPKEPIFFSKFTNCIIGPRDNIIYPPVTQALDYEAELAVIIGMRAKDVPVKEARDYIFGYTVAQDITARDWQKEKNGGQFLLGKSMDTFLPLGPAIVHHSVIPCPDNLNITCKVNGIEKQNQCTSYMIFKIDEIIAYLSKLMTLEPGDIILTGTPGGVGAHRSPPEFLQIGDVIETEIECIGKIINEVHPKPERTENDL